MTGLGFSAALFLAGLGFFFTGLDGLNTHLRQMASRRFRSVLSRFTSHPLLASFWGFVLGAITQSASLVSFVIVGMVSSGLLPLTRALVVLAWANLGTIALVFIAAVDILPAIYILIGITGIVVAFRLVGRFAVPLRALYSLGVLFLGLRIMRDATVPLPDYPWFASALRFLEGSDLLVFLLGALARTVIQSSSAIMVISLTLSRSGVLGGEQVLLVMHGAAAGVGLSLLLLSAGGAGLSRQIALFQAAINTITGLVFLGLFELEAVSGLPFLRTLLAQDALGDPAFRLALCFMVQQVVVVLLGTAVARSAPAVLERWAPATSEQDQSRPRFVGATRAHEPGVALVLAEKEQSRILELVPTMLEEILEQGRRSSISAVEALRVSESLDQEIRHYLEELVESQELDAVSAQRLLEVEERGRALMTLVHSTTEFCDLARADVRDPRVASLVRDLSESLHAILLTTVDTLREPDEIGLSILAAMTSDRGDMMSEVRARFVSASDGLGVREKSALMFLTTLFERIVWVVSRMAARSRAGVDSQVASRSDATLADSVAEVAVG